MISRDLSWKLESRYQILGGFAQIFGVGCFDIGCGLQQPGSHSHRTCYYYYHHHCGAGHYY